MFSSLQLTKHCPIHDRLQFPQEHYEQARADSILRIYSSSFIPCHSSVHSVSKSQVVGLEFEIANALSEADLSITESY